jgi:hypothetical protein
MTLRVFPCFCWPCDVKDGVVLSSKLQLFVFNYSLLALCETTQSMLLLNLPLVTQPRVTSPVVEYTHQASSWVLSIFLSQFYFYKRATTKRFRYQIPHTFHFSHTVMFVVHPGLLAFTSGVITMQFALFKSRLPMICNVLNCSLHLSCTQTFL